MAFIILNFHDQLIWTVRGWLNNPSVSEIFLRNSLLLQRDRRPVWKVEMVKSQIPSCCRAPWQLRDSRYQRLLEGFSFPVC